METAINTEQQQQNKELENESNGNTDESKSMKPYDVDKPLTKLVRGWFIKKEELTTPKIVRLNTLIYNNFGKPTFNGNVEAEGNRAINITLSPDIYNKAIDVLGPDLKKWAGKKIKVWSKPFEGNDTLSPGYTLDFELLS